MVDYSAFPSTGEISFADIRQGFGVGNNSEFSMADALPGNENSSFPENNSFFMSQLALPLGTNDSVTMQGFRPLGLELEIFDDKGGTYVVEDEVLGTETVAKIKAVSGTADNVPSWFTPRVRYTFVDSSQPNSVMPSDFDSGTHEGILSIGDLINGTPVRANIRQDYSAESDNDRSYLRIPDWQGNWHSNITGGTGTSDSNNTPHTQIFSDFSLSFINPNCVYTNVTSEFLTGDSNDVVRPVHPGIDPPSYSPQIGPSTAKYQQLSFSGWRIFTTRQPGSSSGQNSVSPQLGFGTFPGDSSNAFNYGSSTIFGQRTDNFRTGRFLDGPSSTSAGEPGWIDAVHNQSPPPGITGSSAFNATYSLNRYNTTVTTNHVIDGVSYQIWAQDINNYPIGANTHPGLGCARDGTPSEPGIRIKMQNSIFSNSGSFSRGGVNYIGKGFRASGQVLFVSKEYGLKAGTKVKFKWSTRGNGRNGYEIMAYLIDRRTGNFYKIFDDCDGMGNLNKYASQPWPAGTTSVGWVSQSSSSTGHGGAWNLLNSSCPYITVEGGQVPVNSQYNIIVLLGCHDAAPNYTGKKYTNVDFALTGFEFVRP